MELVFQNQIISISFIIIKKYKEQKHVMEII